MNLAPRTVRTAPPWCRVGARLHAFAPTLSRPLTGIVDHVDGTTVTLALSTGMRVAVDVEDCKLAVSAASAG